MGQRRTGNIHQHDLHRRWLTAQLDAGGLAGPESQAALRQSEDLDLVIAAQPAENCAALLVKLERLAEVLMPDPDTQPDTIEAILLQALLRDLRRLAHQDADG